MTDPATVRLLVTVTGTDDRFDENFPSRPPNYVDEHDDGATTAEVLAEWMARQLVMAARATGRTGHAFVAEPERHTVTPAPIPERVAAMAADVRRCTLLHMEMPPAVCSAWAVYVLGLTDEHPA